MRLRSALLTGLAATSFATTAHAFNPNEGAEDYNRAQAARYQPTQPLSASIVPPRYYTPAPRAQIMRPVPVAAAATQPVAPAPIIQEAAPAITYTTPTYNAPTYNTPAPMPAPISVPTAGYVQAAPEPMADPAAVAPRHSRKADRFALGMEVYYDEYREDIVSLKDKGVFGSVTGNYTHYFNPRWYGEADIRGSLGRTDYESTSGTIDDIPQWEIEGRLLAGYNESMGNGQHIKIYTGLGTRYFVDELKGEVSSLGASGYDRRILQFYLPIGVTYEFAAYGLQFAPNLEFDKLLYGYVNSRLQTLPGFYELNNTQRDGYGIRGEMMMAALDPQGRGWQFGPFLRYWNIPDSKIDRNPLGAWLEPENTRLQAGASLKYRF